ncbi:MAG TPA: sulfur carrier protein ThiS [Chromatiales bacterium]|nr:sulfur carrier protein ThiS [Chromatiales bacterium]
MEILINGERRQVAEGVSIAEVLKMLDLAGRRVAVEVNLEIIPRGEHEGRKLQPGDRVEIVQAIGGG